MNVKLLKYFLTCLYIYTEIAVSLQIAFYGRKIRSLATHSTHSVLVVYFPLIKITVLYDYSVHYLPNILSEIKRVRKFLRPKYESVRNS